jgi:hypothetical protein
VKKDDHDLFVATIRHFRAWGAALRTAGIDSEVVSGKRTWTGDRVIQEIHRLAREGVTLNFRSIKRLDQGLVQAARKRLGSWDNALWAAGFDPLTIRRIRRVWTKSEVVAAIRARAAAGAPLTQKGMNSNSLPPAARRLFGSFRAALRKAGVLYLAGTFPRWSRTIIIKAIRARCSAGKPLHCTGVIRDAPRLYDAARHYFQGWSQALRAAGIDPICTRRKRRPWTPEDVTRELRRRARAGQPATCISSIRPVSLVRACVVFFGSLEDAAVAAKVDPAKIGYRRSRGNLRCRDRGQANGRRC